MRQPRYSDKQTSSAVEGYRLGVKIARMALDGDDWVVIGDTTGMSKTAARHWASRLFRLSVGKSPTYRSYDINKVRLGRVQWHKRLDVVAEMLDGMSAETPEEVKTSIIDALKVPTPRTKEGWESDIAAARAAISGVGYEAIALEMGASSSTIGAGVRRVIVLAAKADPDSEVPDIQEAQTMPELWLPRIDQIERFLEVNGG